MPQTAMFSNPGLSKILWRAGNLSFLTHCLFFLAALYTYKVWNKLTSQVARYTPNHQPIRNWRSHHQSGIRILKFVFNFEAHFALKLVMCTLTTEVRNRNREDMFYFSLGRLEVQERERKIVCLFWSPKHNLILFAHKMVCPHFMIILCFYGVVIKYLLADTSSQAGCNDNGHL